MADTAIKEYISQDMFNMQIKHLRERADSDKQVSSARFERLEALMEKTLIEIKMDNAKLHNDLKEEVSSIRGDIKLINERLEGKINALDERIDKNLAQYEAITNDIKGDVKAINAKFETLQNKFAWNLTLFGIIIGAVLAIIQHFWR